MTTSSCTRLGCVALFFAHVAPAVAMDADVEACMDKLTTYDQRACADALYRTASEQLEEVVRRATQRTTLEHAASIRNSQAAWEAYRNAECNGVVGRPGGTGARAWALGCLTEKTRDRIKEVDVPFYAR